MWIRLGHVSQSICTAGKTFSFHVCYLYSKIVAFTKKIIAMRLSKQHSIHFMHFFSYFLDQWLRYHNFWFIKSQSFLHFWFGDIYKMTKIEWIHFNFLHHSLATSWLFQKFSMTFSLQSERNFVGIFWESVEWKIRRIGISNVQSWNEYLTLASISILMNFKRNQHTNYFEKQ